MIIHNFTNDYSEGCHPSILQALAQSNLAQEEGYGDDTHTKNAADLIRKFIQNSNADVHLIAGGTLVNLLVLASILKPFESVIAVTSGHIHTHEAAAVEATGHKIDVVPAVNGKLTLDNLKPLISPIPQYNVAKPRVVYISNATEVGTVYSKKELTELSEYCHDHNLILFVDGARLAAALTANSNDITIGEFARLVDIFYIGGTKCGALLGEAVVITNDELKKDFKYHVKQRGAMLAKGRIMGIQFEQLMQNNLMFQLATRANESAAKIKNAMAGLGFSFLTDSDTNQLFPILPNALIEQLHKSYEFMLWQAVDDEHSIVRIVTSWATPEEKVEQFINDLKNQCNEMSMMQNLALQNHYS